MSRLIDAVPGSGRGTFPSLRGRNAFVTGGAAGIGAAVVRALAAQGTHVAFVDIAVEAGERLAREISAAGGSVVFRACDLTDIAAVQAVLAEIEAELGNFHVLVNNAANDDRHDWRKVTPAYWDERLAVNLRHMFFVIQAIAPGMIAAGGGSIINFGSTSWTLGLGGMAGYTSAKAAVHGLTRGFARDLGSHGIRVNTLSPGTVMTERQTTLWITEEDAKKIVASQSLKRLLQPDDITGMVLFLAAEDSAMCSAQNFVIDGGWV